MRQWVFAAPIGEPFFVWCEGVGEDGAAGYKAVTFTAEAAARYVENTTQAIDAWRADAIENGVSPYLPPILREHQAGGWRGGSIHGAKVASVNGRPGILLDVEWLPSVAADIAANHTNFVSIGTLATYVDYKGRSFSPIINELSITEDPRLKNLGTIQDTTGLRLSDALNTGAKKMDEQAMIDLMAKLDEIMKRLDALEQRQKEVEDAVVTDPADAADKTTAAEGDVDPADKTAEVDPAVKLSEQLVTRAIKLASDRLGTIRLNDLPAGGAPAVKSKDRRAEGIKKGLTGKALADYTLGIA